MKLNQKTRDELKDAFGSSANVCNVLGDLLNELLDTSLVAAVVATLALVEAADVAPSLAVMSTATLSISANATSAAFDVATGKLHSAAQSSAAETAPLAAACTSFPLWFFSMSRASRAFTIGTTTETAPRAWKNWAQFCWDNLSPGSAGANEMFGSADISGVDNWTVRSQICRAYEVAMQKTEAYSRTFVPTQSGGGAIAGVWRHQWIFPQTILLAWGYYCEDKTFNSLYYTRFNLKGSTIATDRCSGLSSATVTGAFTAARVRLADDPGWLLLDVRKDANEARQTTRVVA